MLPCCSSPHSDLGGKDEGWAEMGSTEMEDFFFSKRLCCYLLPRVKAVNHGTIAEPDPQGCSQKRGEALSLLTMFGAQTRRSLKSFLYWLPGLDLAPDPTPATFLMHISLMKIL